MGYVDVPIVSIWKFSHFAPHVILATHFLTFLAKYAVGTPLLTNANAKVVT